MDEERAEVEYATGIRFGQEEEEEDNDGGDDYDVSAPDLTTARLLLPPPPNCYPYLLLMPSLLSNLLILSLCSPCLSVSETGECDGKSQTP